MLAGGQSPRPWTTRTPRRPRPRPRPGESTSRRSTLSLALPCGGGSAVPRVHALPCPSLRGRLCGSPNAAEAWKERHLGTRGRRRAQGRPGGGETQRARDAGKPQARRSGAAAGTTREQPHPANHGTPRRTQRSREDTAVRARVTGELGALPVRRPGR